MWCDVIFEILLKSIYLLITQDIRKVASEINIIKLKLNILNTTCTFYILSTKVNGNLQFESSPQESTR